MFKIFCYLVAAGLLIGGFIAPPTGEIHPSVLTASGLLLAGWQLLFGKGLRSIHLDKNGLTIKTEEDKEE